MFQISPSPIDLDAERQDFTNRSAGAYVSFEGWVRDHNAGKAVSALEYEVYPALALNEGAAILQDVRSRFAIQEIRAVHRSGVLAIGDLAVWIGVIATHRKEAFAACEYAIDAIKRRLPIWKKEFYVGEPPVWVHCAHTHTAPADAFYKRQLCLPEVGSSGQEKLRGARVLVIGAGGLGAPVLSYIAGAGVGHITICDPDRLSVDNLHRQVIYRAADVGRPKAELAAQALQALNPLIRVDAVFAHFDADTSEALLEEQTLVFDCTDHLGAKYAVHDACHQRGIPLVQASIYQWEGQIQFFAPHSQAGCLRCVWPDIPDPTRTKTCQQAGTIGAIAGTIGAMQAAIGLRAILGCLTTNDDHTLLVDLRDHQITRLQRPKDPACTICGTGTDIGSCEMSVAKLLALDPRQFQFIDLRQPEEVDPSCPWEECLTPYTSQTLSQPTILVCAHGIRSLYATLHLRAEGYPAVYSLTHGIDALRCIPLSVLKESRP